MIHMNARMRTVFCLSGCVAFGLFCVPLRAQDVPEALHTNALVSGVAPMGGPMPPPRRLLPPPRGMETNRLGVPLPAGGYRRPDPPQTAPSPVHVGSLPSPTEALPATAIRPRLLYNVEYCTNEMELTNGCLETTSTVAVGRLQALFTQEFTRGKRRGDLKITLLPSLDESRQSALLLEVETNVVKNVAEYMVSQTRTISPAPGDPAGTQKQKFVEDVNRAIEVWNKKALIAAVSGSLKAGSRGR